MARPPPPLTQFVVLSLLLHALAITLFGAPSGGSREGRAMWGPLRVELRAPAADPVAGALLDPLALPRAAAPLAPLDPAPRVTAALPEPAGIPAPIAIAPARRVLPALAAAPAIRAPRAAPVIAIAPLEVPALPATPRASTPLVDSPVIALAPLPAIAPLTAGALERIDAVASRTDPAPAQLAPAPAILAAPDPPVAAPEALMRPPSSAPPQPAPSPPARSPFHAPAPAPAPDPFAARPPAADYDPTAPAIDLEAARRRAGELAREGSGNRALLPFPMPPLPERKSRLRSAIENARKPDCRTAWQGLGLAAIVPLIANEFGDGNCRW